MKIAHVLSDLSRQGAGVTSVVESLSAAQLKLGVSVRVFGLDSSEWRDTDHKDWQGAQTSAALVHGPASFGYAPEMAQQLKKWKPDVVHLHGMWMYPSLAVLHWHAACKKPFVISTHGMLSHVGLSYSKSKKRAVRLLYQDKAFHRAACLHATSLSEVHEIEDFGLRSPISLIPNGISRLDRTSLLCSSKTYRVLSLGRIHHKKGLDRLIAAWEKLPNDLRHWQLDIVGPEEGNYGEILRQQIIQTDSKNISIRGPVYGEDKIKLMAEADIFVLPTRNENFGLTVAESLMLEVPVISTRCAPWSGLENNRCGRWVEPSVDAISEALVELMRKPKEELNEMGLRGRTWMLREFDWTDISKRMLNMYQWMIDDSHFCKDLRS